MKVFALAALAIAAASPALAQQLQVNTITGIVQCEPSLLTWSGGQPPYFLTFIPVGQPSAAPIKSFPKQSGTQLTWIADLPAGTSFNIQLRDNTGATAFSDQENITNGTDSSCLNTAVTESGSDASGATSAPADASSTAAGGASTTPAGSTVSGSSPASTNRPASSSSSGAAPAQTSHSGGMKTTTIGAFGIAGLAGLIGAALF